MMLNMGTGKALAAGRAQEVLCTIQTSCHLAFLSFSTLFQTAFHTPASPRVPTGLQPPSCFGVLCPIPGRLCTIPSHLNPGRVLQCPNECLNFSHVGQKCDKHNLQISGFRSRHQTGASDSSPFSLSHFTERPKAFSFCIVQFHLSLN